MLSWLTLPSRLPGSERFLFEQLAKTVTWVLTREWALARDTMVLRLQGRLEILIFLWVCRTLLVHKNVEIGFLLDTLN